MGKLLHKRACPDYTFYECSGRRPGDGDRVGSAFGTQRRRL